MPLFNARFLFRLALAFVFIAFGIWKFIDPGYWFAWIPRYALPYLPVTKTVAMYLLGAVETVIGAAVLFDFRTRAAAAIAAVMLAAIIMSFGWSEMMVRDVGVFLIALGLAFGKGK